MGPMGKGSWGFYAVDAFGESLDGTAGARACTIHGVIKQNTPGAPHLVANEFICGRLAAAMGLPVPPGGIVKLDDDSLAYVSLRFGLNGEQPPPAYADELVADLPDLALRIVAFDCWVANRDRHEGNLTYERRAIPPMVFDHEKALMGGIGPDRLDGAKGEAILNGCLALKGHSSSA